MNVQTREDFDRAKAAIKAAKHMVVDTETNGLRYGREHRIISISIYIPEIDTTFNLPFRHGQGEVEIDWTVAIPEGTPYAEMGWAGKAKQQVYLSYWFNNYAEGRDFGNLPIEWLDELKEVWGNCPLIFHNARFDLHMLECEGFPRPPEVEDTMIGLHVLNEDWGGMQVEAPFVWTETDKRKGLCSQEQVGTWATLGGKLATKRQNANRRLKWFAAWLQFEDATKGEQELLNAVRCLEHGLAVFATLHPDDPYNVGLCKESINGSYDAATELLSEHDPAALNAHHKELALAGTAKEATAIKHRLTAEAAHIRAVLRNLEVVKSKIHIDTKSNMWMLPSWDVANYAELDVKLTWKLRNWVLSKLGRWNNLELYHTQNAVMYEVAWAMERNGVRLNVAHAEEELNKLRPQIDALQNIINDIVCAQGFAPFKVGSHAKLKEFINQSKVLEQDISLESYPDFWEPEHYGDLCSYTDAQVPTTSKDSLEQYDGHLFVRLVLDYRKRRMAAETYLANWIRAADATGIVRGQMNADGTVSGRFSSSGEAGNWQNIPSGGGYTIKRAVTSYSPEWVFFAIDYGQLEARLAAWIAEELLGLGNHEMTSLFLAGVDMHSYTRDMVGVQEVVYPGLSVDEICHKLGYTDMTNIDPVAVVAKRCRFIGKTMNFGLLYSGTGKMLSSLLKIDLGSAKALVHKWHMLFPAFAQAQEHYEHESLRLRPMPNSPQYARYSTQPISNRHRKLTNYPTTLTIFQEGEWVTFNPMVAASRKVWNNIVQGLGGYICTVSGLKICRRYPGDQLRLFANIHDELAGFVHYQHMSIIKDVANIMASWEITPALTVDLAGSKDGTWQGKAEVKNFDLWVNSGGQEGY